MKFSELREKVNLYADADRNGDKVVVIEVTLPYSTVGGTPTVGIKNRTDSFPRNI